MGASHGSLISENGKRATNGRIALLMPQKVVRKYRDRYSSKGKIIHRNSLLFDTDYTILQRYQGVLRGIYNYYCMAVNVSRRMNRIGWILSTSLTKTLACKFRCRVSQIYRKYRAVVLDRKMLRVVIERPGKEALVATFGGFPFERIPDGLGAKDFRFETAWYTPGDERTEVVQRLLAGKCELCDAEKVPVTVHHIRKLADI